MTDQSEEKGPKLPPRIKLNLNAEAASPAPSADSKMAEEAQPQKPSSPPPPPTSSEQEKPPQTEGKKIKLNLDAALENVEKPAEQSGSPNQQPEAKQETPPAKQSEADKPKIKLNLSEFDEPQSSAPAKEEKVPAKAQEPSAEESPKPADEKSSPETDAPSEAPAADNKPKLTLKTKPEAEQSKPETSEPAQADAESEAPTQEPSSADKSIALNDIEGESLDDLYQAALNATQRVILDEKEKAATNKIETDEAQVLKKAELAEASKKSTARLDLGEMLSNDEQKEIMKHETMHIRPDGSTPEKPKPSGTMKIQRPEKSEQEEISGSTMPIPLDLEESKKSETARIDLPRDVASNKPASGRKTIRIKRPDGSGAAPRPTLNVARSSSSSASQQSSSTAAEEAARNAISFDQDEAEKGSPLFGALALVAVLVGLALVYVLVATLTPALPFPGRLV